jgi:hypothetical protein
MDPVTTENLPESFLREPPDRVRAHTRPELLEDIDRQIEQNIRLYAGQPKEIISRRIEQLDREWDMERVLQTNASSLALTSLVLGLSLSRKWLLMTAGVLGFLFQHAVQGWCPPITFFRRRGIRTRQEIDREKYALRILRGDFGNISSIEGGNGARVNELLSAIKE